MWPEVKKIYRSGQAVKAIPDPLWMTEPDANEGNTLLHIRDPRYGWLHYMIPREDARKLAAYIQNQVDPPRPRTIPDNPKYIWQPERNRGGGATTTLPLESRSPA